MQQVRVYDVALVQHVHVNEAAAKHLVRLENEELLQHVHVRDAAQIHDRTTR